MCPPSPTYNTACPSIICVSLQHRLTSVDSLYSSELCWAMAVVNGKTVCLEGQVLLGA
jgi:hypothetical protein